MLGGLGNFLYGDFPAMWNTALFPRHNTSAIARAATEEKQNASGKGVLNESINVR